MLLTDWILKRHSPSVAVLSTSVAETACQEQNGLTVVELLRPFSDLQNLSGESVPLGASECMGCVAVLALLA